MKKLTKPLAVLLFTVIAIFSFTITASATDESNPQDGLVASITSSKDSYTSDEDIELTFKVTNTNDYAVENVSLEAIIPDGLTLKNKADTKINTVSLPAEDSLELSLVVVKGGTTSNTTTNTVNTKSSNNTVATGNNIVSYIIVGLVCLLCLVVAIVSFKFRKKTAKYLSIVLCVCISVGAVAVMGILSTSVSAETVQTMSFEISKTITVDDSKYQIKENVSYTKISTNSNDKFVPSRDADRYTSEDLYTSTPDKEHMVIDKDSGMQFVDNEICIDVKENTTQNDIEKICAKYNAYIVGKNTYLNSYTLRFKESYSYVELNQIISNLNNEEVIKEASLNLVVHYTTSEYYPISQEDRWTNDWDSIPSGANWGIEAINVPEAWEYIDLMQDVKVGVFDQGFDVNHEDLKDKIENASLYPNNPLDHGTHVMGIIGAEFENGIGINGISPTANFSLYNFNNSDSDTASFKYAMTYLIEVNKSKVINMSLGINSEYLFSASKGNLSAQEYLKAISQDYEKTLKELSANNDFVICHSAGNDCGYSYYKSDNATYGYYKADQKIPGNYIDDDGNSKKWTKISSPDSGNNQVLAIWKPLSLIDDEELKNRIIVVGAVQNESNTTAKYSLCDFSNIGDRVDVVAPGFDIESTISNNSYESQPGTSMASPHVAGIASLLYSLDPDIKGDEVKRIICDTATTEVDGYNLVDAEAAVKEVLGQGTLSATVVSSDNTALSNVRVDAYLNLKSGQQYLGNTSYTNSSGNFSMNLQGGNYEIRLNKDGYQTAAVTITVSKDVITFFEDPITMEKLSDDNDDVYDGKCGDNLNWKLSDDGTLVISGTGDMYDYSEFTFSPWYDRNAEIKSIVLEDGVTGIGTYAFINCENMTSLSISSTVTSIGNSAFWNCRTIEKIDIPNSVETIGSGAFRFCRGLKWLTISDNAKYLDSYAFADCDSLVSVKLGYNLENIGYRAFYQCKSLETIIIPYGTTTIGEKAFYGCSNLSYIRVPSSVTDIGSEAFSNIDSNFCFRVHDNTYAYDFAYEYSNDYAIENEVFNVPLSSKGPDSVNIYDNDEFSQNYNKTVSSITLNVGYCYNLKALGIIENDIESSSNAEADTDFSWSISDTDVIQFASNSIAHRAYNDEADIEAKNKGTATITVKTSNGKTATCIVTVE